MEYTHAAAALFTLVAAASAQQQNGTIFECTSEGRFPDPFDCMSFFTCVAETDGSLVRTKGDCKSYAFHPDLRTCVNPSKVPGCSSRKPKQLTSDKSLSEVCTNSAFVCGNCKTVVNCIGTEAYKDSTCGDGYSCSTSGSGSLSGTAVCLPNDRADTTACLCTPPADVNQPKPDPNTNKGFIYCPIDGVEAQIYKCSASQMYNAEKKKCVSYDDGEICTQQGTFKKKDCSGLYTCWYSPEGLVKRNFFSCDPGTMVSTLEEICTDPCIWPSPNHKCIEEGRFKDPTDCSKFVVCEEAGGSGGYDQTIGQCPGNYLWDETAVEGLGHCVDPDSVTCDPPVSKKSSCPIEDIVCP